MKRRFKTILRFSVFTLFVSLFFSPVVFADTTSVLLPIADGGDDSADWANTLAEYTCDTADCHIDVAESSGTECTNSSDGDLSYIISTVNGASQTFDIDESVIPDDSTITQIDITVCYRKGFGTNPAFQTRYCHNSSCADSGANLSPASSYTGSTQSHTVSFTKTSSSDVEIGIINKAAKTIRVSKISAVITYTPPVPADTTTPGGGGAVMPTIVTFSGEAFPSAKILVVDKDMRAEKTVSQDLVVSEEGKFNISFVGILQGPHSFGLLVKDKNNLTTQTKFFNIDTLENDLVIKDILVPPTASFTQGVVARGQNAVITGYAAPENDVKIEIGDIKKEIKAEKDGFYKAEVDTGILEFGQYRMRVKQIDPQEKKESDFSVTKTLVVSRLTSPKADFSGDGKVDIKDWSMFLSNWGSKDEGRKKTIDLNGDEKIDISDFSIFIRTIRK